MKYLITLFLAVTASTSILLAQGGNGVQNVANYGGNGGENEFCREVKGQKYFTKFQNTPLDTTKTISFGEIKLAISEEISGYEKNFKSGKRTGATQKSSEFVTSALVKSPLIKQNVEAQCGKYGLKTSTGSDGIKLNGTIKSIEYDYQLKKGEVFKISLKISVEWDFIKNGETLFKTTTKGSFLKLSDAKVECGVQYSLQEALIESLDKVFSIEDFKKAFAL